MSNQFILESEVKSGGDNSADELRPLPIMYCFGYKKDERGKIPFSGLRHIYDHPEQ